jgi:hypothetical protein
VCQESIKMRASMIQASGDHDEKPRMHPPICRLDFESRLSIGRPQPIAFSRAKTVRRSARFARNPCGNVPAR